MMPETPLTKGDFRVIEKENRTANIRKSFLPERVTQ